MSPDETQRDSGRTKRVKLTSESEVPSFQRVCPKCKLPVIGGIEVCPRDGTEIDANEETEAPANQRKLSDRYDHMGSLGSGGMSVVYKARDRNLDRVVAVKQLMRAVNSGQTVLRFQREACAYAALKHPNIVNVFDFGFDEENKPFLVMDFLEGKTLDEMIAESGSLTIPQALEVFIQLLDGLSHAHLKGIIHRDLKPANIMIQRLSKSNRVQVKIMDFGIAKVRVDDSEAAWETQAGQVMGSPLYMSPEQSISSDVDARADIYSVGCMLFEALTGHPPFRGENLMETITMHRSAEPPRISDIILQADIRGTGSLAKTVTQISTKIHKVLPQFPAFTSAPAVASRDSFWLDMEAIVLTAIAKNPDDRYQSALDLRADLLCVKENWDKAQDKGITETQRLARTTRGDSKKRKIAVGCAITLPILLGIAIYSNLTRQPDSSNKVSQLVSSSGRDYWAGGQNNQTRIVIPEDAQLEALPADKVGHLCIGKDANRTLKGISRFRGLHSMFVQNLTIDQSATREIANLKFLDKIAFTDCTFAENALQPLSKIRSLRALEFRGGQLSKDNCLMLPMIPGLEELIMEAIHNVVKGDGLEPIGKIEGLRKLALHQMAVDDNGVKYLCDFPRLQVLFLDMANVTDKGCKEIAKLKSLTALNFAMAHAWVGDMGVKELATLPKLMHLDIRGSQVTDKGLMYLVNAKSLHDLNIEGCRKVTEAGVMRFKGSREDVQVKFGETVMGIQEVLLEPEGK